MHEVLVNRLGGLSLPRKSVVRLTDRPDMTLDVYRGRKTTKQQQQQQPALSYLRGIQKYSFGLFKQIESVCVCIFIVNSCNISIYDIILDVLAVLLKNILLTYVVVSYMWH